MMYFNIFEYIALLREVSGLSRSSHQWINGRVINVVVSRSLLDLSHLNLSLLLLPSVQARRVPGGPAGQIRTGLRVGVFNRH